MLWPVLVSIVVVVALAVALNLRTEAVPTLFVEDLREQASTMGRKAGTFRDLLERMASVDRVELVDVVEDIESSGEGVREFLAAEPPESLAGQSAVFRLAVDSWVEGATELRDALLLAADDPAATPDERVIDALLDLRAGDRLYLTFVEELESGDLPRPVAAMPEVAFLPSPYPITSAARTLVAQAAADESPLELRAALRIQQVTTEPEWVLDTEDRLVVEETELLTVKVVVANQGNTASEPGSVTVELTGGEREVQAMEMPFDGLDAGTTTTVTFLDLLVVPGQAYQLVVRLPLAPGEVETEDNARALAFRVNEPTPDVTTTTHPSTTTAG